MKKIKIYTDGACRGNPGPGGWGALLEYNGLQKKLHGGECDTTNNRMELMAAIKALEALNEPCEIDFTVDSEYVKNGITTWIINWKKNNWRTKNKGAVKNSDLWQRLDLLVQKHKITWLWVKGHSGHKENDIVDGLANLGVDEVLCDK
ncbi:MAG: ribonuclease HI [Gammaproteobacteria bacterium]|nr:ribonuclease HI [Gammaproteobacteria bacterium]